MAEGTLRSAAIGGGLPVVDSWGILRLLPRWLGDRVADGGRDDHWPDIASRPVVERGDQPLATPSELETVSRTAGIQLRRTLDEWRAAERALAAPGIGASDRERLTARIATLRASYGRLFAEVCRPVSSG